MWWISAAVASPVVVVIVDEEARMAGYALEVEDEVLDTPLPVTLHDDEPVHLLGPRGLRERMDLSDGEAWEIQGSSGELWMSLLEEDVRIDLIEVRADSVTVAELARAIDGDVIEEGGRTFVYGPEALYGVARLRGQLAAEVDQVSLVFEDDLADPPSDESIERSRVTSRAVVRAVPSAAQSARQTPSMVVLPTSVARPTALRDVGGLFDHATPTGELMAVPMAEVSTKPNTAALDTEAYAGVHLCRGQLLTLSPSGYYAFGGATGPWRVSAPGVVRLLSPDGAELWWRAAFGLEHRQCVEVWD